MNGQSGTFRGGLKFGAGIAVALLSVAGFTALLAQTINSFSSGETISSSQMNTNFQMVAPEGLIAAFYLSACPDGWVAADGTNSTPDLRGRFLRALDDFGSGAAGIDPDGVRVLGAAQEDAFQGHRHGVSWSLSPLGFAGTQSRYAGGDPRPTTTSFTILDPTNDGTNGTPRTASETRPTNVALLYCMRKDT